MNLGENIYRLRSEHNMSQGDLADALEVSRQSVSKWENNSAVPELDKLVKMAHIFGITLDEMVTGAEAPPAPKAEIPEPAPARSSRLTSAQILGIVLLVFSGLCFLVFTVVGIQRAYTATEHRGLFLLVFVGVVTGVGGGLLRDVMAGNTPYIFVKHVYASASIIGAILCVVLWQKMMWR